MFPFSHHETVATTPTGLNVESVHDDPPAFERVYTAPIERGIHLKITIKTSYGRAFVMGELTQSNGRWVLFEPKSPADKILDRDILPLVEKYCAEVLALDRQFRASRQTEYTDTNGDVWKRA